MTGRCRVQDPETRPSRIEDPTGRVSRDVTVSDGYQV